MTEVVFTERAAARDLVQEAISKIPLPKNSLGQYNHDDIITLQKGISRVFGTQYNPGTPGQGMNQLLDVGDNALTSGKSTGVITLKSIIAVSKAEADALAPLCQEGTPRIMTRSDALDEADRRNLTKQAVIGSKEGATEAISNLVCSDVTNGIIRLLDDKDCNVVDKYTL